MYILDYFAALAMTEFLKKNIFNLIPRGLAAGTLAMGFPKGSSVALPFGRSTGFHTPWSETYLINRGLSPIIPAPLDCVNNVKADLPVTHTTVVALRY